MNALRPGSRHTAGALLVLLLNACSGAASPAGVSPPPPTPPPAATAILSASSLSFTSLEIGSTSASQPVTLTDSGNVSLRVTGISTAGDFGQSNNCGTSVGIGAQCTIQITFTPTAAGSRSGTLSISDNAAASAQTVQLSGPGVIRADGGTPASFFAMNLSLIPDWPTVPSLGAVRLWDTHTAWEFVETSRGTYDWTTLDSWVAAAQAHGVDVLYTLGRTPAWASAAGTPNTPPADLATWDEFVTALATRYRGQIKYYEGWNEPNAPNFYNGTTAQLVALQQHAYGIVHQLDPAALVLTPPPATAGSTVKVSQFLSQFFAAGGGAYADIVAFHAYTPPDAELIVTLLKNVTDSTPKYGQASKPLWITEGGWSTQTILPDPDLQAAFAAKHLLLARGLGIARYYWYGYDFAPWGTLFDKASKTLLKPGIAYREVQKWMSGATTGQVCAQDALGTWTCSFTRANGYQAVAVWNNNGGTYAPGIYKQYRDIGGNTFSVSGRLTLSNAPILLETGPGF